MDEPIESETQSGAENSVASDVEETGNGSAEEGVESGEENNYSGDEDGFENEDEDAEEEDEGEIGQQGSLGSSAMSEDLLQQCAAQRQELLDDEDFFGWAEATVRFIQLHKSARPEMVEELALLMEEAVSICNSKSMEILPQGDEECAEELLMLAKKILEEEAFWSLAEQQRMKITALTCNNLGCLYRAKGSYLEALDSMEQALKLEVTMQDVTSPATVHLNLCALHSQLGNNERALEHAELGLDFLRIEVNEWEKKYKGGGEDMDEAAEINGRGVIKMLIIGYHNWASVLQALKRFDEGKDAYKRALDIAKSQFGDKDPMTKLAKDNYKNACRVVKQHNQEWDPNHLLPRWAIKKREKWLKDNKQPFDIYRGLAKKEPKSAARKGKPVSKTPSVASSHGSKRSGSSRRSGGAPQAAAGGMKADELNDLLEELGV